MSMNHLPPILWNFDNVLLHRAENAQQFLLLRFRHFKRVERCDEIFHKGVKVCGRDSHARMRSLHIPARIGARPAGGLAHLVDQVLFELWDIGGRKSFIDPLVVGDVRYKLINDCRDGRLSSETIIERLFLSLAGLRVHR